MSLLLRGKPNTYLKRAYDANLNYWSTDAPHTIACRFWIEYPDLSAERYLISADGGGGLPLYLTVQASNQVIKMTYLQQTLSTRTATGTTRLWPKRSYHVAVVCVPSSRFDIYLNGVWEAGQTFTTTLRDEATTPWVIGGSANGYSLDWHWRGQVSHACLFARALTIPEVRSLASGNIDPQRLNAAAAWLCSEDDLLLDLSGNDRPQSLNGNVGFGPKIDIPAPFNPVSFNPVRYPFITISAPTCTLDPVISGSPEVGQTLTVSFDGTWTGSPTFTYQWQYNDGAWNNIAGATTNSWVVDVSGAVDAGDSIRCVVTGTNLGGSADANSNTLSPVTVLNLSGHRAVVALG